MTKIQNIPESQANRRVVIPEGVSLNHVPKNVSQPDQLLEKLTIRADLLKEYASKEIVKTPPLVSLDGTGIIRRNTLTIIQGKYGSHKSRKAECYLELFLRGPHKPDPLGLSAPSYERIACCLIDSEKNISEELASTIQKIRKNAGYDKLIDPPNFYYNSFKDLERSERLKALEIYLQHVRDQTHLHLFVVLDVLTDFCKSFNDDVQALALFDFLGQMAERNDCTILGVLHENPTGDSGKARGHVGTEGVNKASTVMSIHRELDGEGNPTELLKIKFIKLRSAAPMLPIYARFDPETEGLRLADADQIKQYKSKKEVLPIDDLADILPTVLLNPMNSVELHAVINTIIKVSPNTLKNRLEKLEASQQKLDLQDGTQAVLTFERVGKARIYQLLKT